MSAIELRAFDGALLPAPLEPIQDTSRNQACEQESRLHF